jgi:hypothetical protein
LGLVGLDRAVELTYGGGLRIELLFRNHAFLKEEFVTLEVRFSVFALGDILGELPLGL